MVSSEMKAIQIHTFGGVEKLSVDDVPIPVPKAGEVLIRNQYSGINYIDVYHRTGLYPMTLPIVPGREGSGIVEAVGEGVTDLAPGDRVAYIGPASYAELTAANSKHVVKLPPGISMEVAAACMLQGLTAALLTFDAYPVKAGDFVLVPVMAIKLSIIL